MRFESQPGQVVLFGSGETSPSGRKVFDLILGGLPASPHLALLETPAGFELNSPQVIGRVADFIKHRLQNYCPQLTVVSARRKGTPFSPDDPQVVAPLLEADLIFMGPGSPSYAIRQLRNSLAWYYLVARHRLGATLALASAAAVAISAYSLPVYEIYKVGEDLHWNEGLDFFGIFGLPLIFIPHWNNNEGGDELDTSRCFMGKSRFAAMMDMLPAGFTIFGIDENTALILDMRTDTGQVVGLGGVTLLHTGDEQYFTESDLNLSRQTRVVEKQEGNVYKINQGQSFTLSKICPFCLPPTEKVLPPAIWEQALKVQESLEHQRQIGVQSESGLDQRDKVFREVRKLVADRQEARQRRDWSKADDLRDQIKSLGWNTEDTPEGTRLVKQ